MMSSSESQESLCESPSRRWAGLLFVVASGLAGVVFLLEGRIGIYPSDGGFLWYGVRRVLQGEMPPFHFQGYDPGRYVVLGGFCWLFGNDGLWVMRMGLAVVHALTLWAALLVVVRVTRSPLALGVIAVVLVCWLAPRHRAFEHLMSTLPVLAGLRLFEQPSRGRAFVLGVVVGLGAVFGANHALYCVLAFCLISFFIFLRVQRVDALPRLLCGGLGGLTGYVPMVVIFVMIPGFMNFYFHKLFLFASGGQPVNLYKPPPWPGLFDYSSLSSAEQVHAGLIGLLLVIVPISYLLWLWKGLRRCEHTSAWRVQTVCAAVGIFYLHHVFTRANHTHLADGIMPFLLGASVPMSRWAQQRKGVLAVSVLSVCLVLPTIKAHPFFWKLLQPKSDFQPVLIEGHALQIRKKNRVYLDAAARLQRDFMRPGEGILVLPDRPFIYAYVNLRCPVYTSYLFFSKSEEEQRGMIDGLTQADVNWVILREQTVDNREDLQPGVLLPVLWQHLEEAFEQVDEPVFPEGFRVLRRKGWEIDRTPGQPGVLPRSPHP